MAVSPDIPEAHALKGWYVDGGAQSVFTSHTQAGMSSGPGGAISRNEMRTIFDVKEAQLGMSDKVDFFSTRATIMHIKTDNLVYPACPTSGCNKKMTENHDGGWRCEKCDRGYEKPEYRSVRLPSVFVYLDVNGFVCRYIISMAVGDHTGQMWLSGFNDVGNTLFGMTGNELHDMKVQVRPYDCGMLRNSYLVVGRSQSQPYHT